MRHLAVLALLALAPILISPLAHAQDVVPRTVTVTATDTVRVAPDRVSVRFAIVTRAQQPEAARQQNESASSNVLQAVRALNVPDRQIQVQSVRLSEEVEYRQGRRVRIGFIARRDVQVILDDMDRLPQVIAAVVQEGATELGGISYDIRDRRAQEDEALRRAASRARQKADVLATSLGTSVRAVYAVAESGTSFPTPRPEMAYARMEMDMAQAEPAAYAAGELEVRATLTVIFELE
jgi:uncharacterized protein